MTEGGMMSAAALVASDAGPVDEVREGRLVRPDGRVVAWSESGVPDGRSLLRVPGTPGSRYSLPADGSLWTELGLRVLVVERPGFGASTRLPGRGFAEHADDVVAVFDALSIERILVHGGSGAAPHALALAARHPDRVAAVTILDGAAPMTDEELAEQIEANVSADRLARAGDVAGLRAVLEPTRAAVLADPVGGMLAIFAGAPDEDLAAIAEPDWLEGPGRGFVEAIRAGVEGWIDELIAIDGDWADIDLAAVRASITWWHSETDRNCPFASAQRLVARLPDARFVVLDGSGHLAGYQIEGEVLDELLARDDAETAGKLAG
jgi:pimeloyl-ACP methyl ester carboxylesterase